MQEKKPFYLPSLDALRFLAFLLIFVHHTNLPEVGILAPLKKIGWVGVDIFFCLSAYLLSTLLQRELAETKSIHVRKFFTRRILRIWPLYFAYVIAILALLPFAVEDASIDLHRVLGLLTYTDNIFAAVDGFNPIPFTGHLWTIAYEEQIYLFLPFLIPVLARMCRGNILVALAVVALISIAVRAALISTNASHPFIYALPVARVESVVAGLALSFVPLHTWSRIGAAMLFVLSAAAVALLPSSDITSWHLLLLYPLVGALSGASLVLALQVNQKSAGVFMRVLIHLGKISFGLYVFHAIAIYSAGWAFQGKAPTLQYLLALGLTILLSEASYYLYERRFLLLKKRFSVIENKPV